MCGTEIADRALICYKCGTATTEPRVKPPDEGPILGRPRRARRPWIVLVVILIVLALLGALYLSGLVRAEAYSAFEGETTVQAAGAHRASIPEREPREKTDAEP
jgi:hypothetical protein